MPRIETSQYVNWLRDKAGRAPELSWMRMMNAIADRLDEQARMISQRMVHDFCCAHGSEELKAVLKRIDESGFQLVCVTEAAAAPELSFSTPELRHGSCGEVQYTVFFRRPSP